MAFSAYAVHPSFQNWHKGELVLSDNQTVNAEFSYDTFTDLIQVKEEHVIKVYSARQVSSFGFFDEKSNQMRRFLSLKYPDRRNRSRKAFFEIVLTGDLYLLRRLHSVRNTNPMQPTLAEAESPWYDRKNMFEYFVYTQNRFIPIRHFRKQIYTKIMSEYDAQLQAFIKEKHLNIYSQRGRFMLINQYNILKNPDLITLF